MYRDTWYNSRRLQTCQYPCISATNGTKVFQLFSDHQALTKDGRMAMLYYIFLPQHRSWQSATCRLENIVEK